MMILNDEVVLMIPGEYIIENKKIIINYNKKTIKLVVTNKSDRPVQVGSHYHFFEVNEALEFDRKAAYGMRLNIPSGTTIRFEPGDAKEVELVQIGGKRNVYGLKNMTNGYLDDKEKISSRLNQIFYLQSEESEIK